jgi:hypothetical protein
MTTAYTSLLGLALPVTGELSGTWGDTVNTAITSLLDTAIAGTTSITTDADITLSTTTGASNQARQAIILWNPASGTVTRNITAPAQSKMYVVINASGGTQSIVIRGAGPTTGVTIAKGESATVAWNGSDFVKVSSSGGAITFTDLTVTGNTILGDAAADTLTVNATSTFNAPVSFAGLVRLPSTGRSAAAALTVTAPAFLYGVASTYTDTTSSGTIAAMAPFYSISAPTLSTSNVTTYSFASTLYVAGAPAAGGSATITNPYALYINSGASYLAGAVSLGSTLAVASTTTMSGNLLFSADNTYNIGANGATRPASAWFSKTVTAGQGSAQNWQFQATDYGQGTGGGYADGIYTNSIKAGTFQGFGFDTQYSNAGSWVSSQTSASIIDGYQGNFRFFGRNDLTAGTAYTPALRFTVGPTGLASLWTVVATDPGIVNSFQIGRSSFDITYGGVLGLRAISGDQRQGLFARSTGSLTNVSLYNIDFLTGQTAVPLAADTGLAMRINSNKAVSIGGSTTDTYPLEIYAAGSASTSKNMLNIYYGAAGSAEATIQFQTANGGIGKLGFLTAGASAGQFQLYTADGTVYVNRYAVGSTGVHSWYNVGSSSGGTAMTLDSAGLGIGATTTGKFLAYQAGSIQNYQGAYGSSGTFQTGTGSVTLGGGANPRGIGVLINANRAVSTTLTYGNNYETFGLIAVANVGTGGGYGTTGIAGYAESDGGVYGLRADAKTTSVGGVSIAVGLYVGSVTGSSTNYGVYVNDSAAVNYFAGSVGIGIVPAARLHVYQASADVFQTIQGDNGYNAYTNYRVFGGGISFGRDGGTGYFRWNTAVSLGGTQVMTLATDYMQLRVNTTQSFSDNYASSTYPGVVSANGLAAIGLGNAGAVSLLAKTFNLSPGNTYTVRVYPSDNTYDVLDIRFGSYCSSGSGSASSFFCYGGHTGAYQLNTVFNSYTGNTVVSSPSVSGNYVQFTVTITGGSSGAGVVKVSDAGSTAGKTAFITVT